MTSHMCVPYDLPTQRDAVENALRDDTQQPTSTTTKGRLWCYFMELKTWAQVTTSVWVDPRTKDVMIQGLSIKNAVKTEAPEYVGAEVTIYKFNKYGPSPDADPVGDDEHVSLTQWIYVQKKKTEGDDDGDGADGADGAATPNDLAQSEPEHPAVDMPKIEKETYVCYDGEWKKVMMPNFEVNAGCLTLKRKALEAFGFQSVDEIILRATGIHWNAESTCRVNDHVIHRRWYMMVVDRAMIEFALEGEQ